VARAGDCIENPLTGERIVFRQTAAETDGELLQFDLVVTPNGAPIVEHTHPRQEETFTVRSGSVQLRLNGVERTLGPGESVVVPAGQPHVWWNASESDAALDITFRPALNTEGFFETMFGLARDGRLGPGGTLSLLQAAVVAPHYEIYLAQPSISQQRLLFTLLGPLARLLGHRARYPQYSEGVLPPAASETSSA